MTVSSTPDPSEPVVRLVTCIGVDTDLPLLAHFLRHYAEMGIPGDRTHVIVHAGSDGADALDEARKTLARFAVSDAVEWIGPYTSDAMWERRRGLQERVASPDDWIVNSDLDEHYEFPAPLREVVRHCLEVGANAVQGLQIDRIARDGALRSIDPATPLSMQFPIEAEVSWHLFGKGRHHGISSTTKLMLHRADVFPRRGGHNPDADRGAAVFLAGRPLHSIARIADPAFRFAFPFRSAHYKWTAARLPSLERRLATPGVSPAGQELGEKVRDYIGRHGRIPVSDVPTKGDLTPARVDWRSLMAEHRENASARRSPGASGGLDVHVVIRSAGERTLDACRALAAAEAGDDRCTVIREVPFAKALKVGLEAGVREGRKWTLCLDADVLLRPGAIADLIDAAERTEARDGPLFEIEGRIADKLLGHRRHAGQHLYRTSLIPAALEIGAFDAALRRPEGTLKRHMKAAGHRSLNVDVEMGIHDFEQSYADIFRTVFVHTRKHAPMMAFAEPFWLRSGATDPDHAVAYASAKLSQAITELRPPEGTGARNVSIDRRQFSDRVDTILKPLGLTEKLPLAAGAIDGTAVIAMLQTFEDAPEYRRRDLPPAASAPRPAGDPDSSTVIRLITCIGVHHDRPLLPHFLAHYRNLEIPPNRFHLILNAPAEDDPALASARRCLERHDIRPAETWIGPYTSGEMWKRRRELQDRVAGPDEWIVNADADEFHRYPAPLAEVVAFLSGRGSTSLQGPFIDRVGRDGTLHPVRADGSISEQFPIAADVGIALGKHPGVDDATGTVKMMLHRSDVHPALGGHYPAGEAAAQTAHGGLLQRFPVAKDSRWRFSQPFQVHHYKWSEGLLDRLRQRRDAAGASAAGSGYGGAIVDRLSESGGRIDLSGIPTVEAADLSPVAAWRPHLDRHRDLGRALSDARSHGALRRSALSAAGRPGWRIRQLTDGTPHGRFHAHSYYDLPILDRTGRRIVAHRMSIQERWMTPDDAVPIGIVDIDHGGFRKIGESRAWSWQQGPMAQWIPNTAWVAWNDRATGPGRPDRFVAQIHETDTGMTRTVPRPIYAVSPDGTTALSLNMARLNLTRPGYGYVGGGGARSTIRAPEDDGLWRIDLATTRRFGRARLILSLDAAQRFLLPHLPAEERIRHDAGDFVYWFNHPKISPDGTRYTVKLRWRDATLAKPWIGLNGISLTADLRGGGLRFVARAASHVMWDGPGHLYFWHQSERVFAGVQDTDPEASDYRVPFPDLITANVHFRHVAGDPRRAVFDRPYAETVDLHELDRASGRSATIASFPNHRPPHGPFRCDLHPVPDASGDRIVVTSLLDGGRQLYVVERDRPSR